MKRPSEDDMDVAAQWLRINEGELGEMESCQRVAEWLELQIKASEFRSFCKAARVSVKKARKYLRSQEPSA